MVALPGHDQVVGYHALTVATISHQDASPRAGKAMPQHPIPAVLLARLAADREFQGKGVGALLLGDALRRSLSVAETAGIRLLLVHASDESVRAFYLKFGFEPSPTDPMNLQLLIKDIRQSLDLSG
ncbi:MAG: GNAT family N-acetyltransferase [Solirubrobacterales bacterium]|nr:GNAT family N-acetyltransferase [Solirubrobacterales bacterium]